MLQEIDAYKIVGVLFIVLIATYFLSFMLKKYLERKGIAQEGNDLGTLQGALLGLFAFFLAFTFNMSANRYDNRKRVIIEESNAIGTAILRADLYPDSIRKEMREHFKQYVDYRIEYHHAGFNPVKVAEMLKRSNSEALQLWSIATTLAKDERYAGATRLMIPALNEMIDIVTTREASLNDKVPESILWVLFILSIFSSFILGYGSKDKQINYIASIIFVAMVSVSIYLIIDLDRPRRGIITVDKANQKIVELKSVFK